MFVCPVCFHELCLPLRVVQCEFGHKVGKTQNPRLNNNNNFIIVLLTDLWALQSEHVVCQSNPASLPCRLCFLYLFIYLFIYCPAGCAAKLIGRDHGLEDHGMEAYLQQIFDAQTWLDAISHYMIIFVYINLSIVEEFEIIICTALKMPWHCFTYVFVPIHV